jgi:hypothetical protein
MAIGLSPEAKSLLDAARCATLIVRMVGEEAREEWNLPNEYFIHKVPGGRLSFAKTGR